jgi:hypothetical protein
MSLYLELYCEESDSTVDVIKGFHEQFLKPPSNHKLQYSLAQNSTLNYNIHYYKM